jgi:hypothetical protein
MRVVSRAQKISPKTFQLVSGEWKQHMWCILPSYYFTNCEPNRPSPVEWEWKSSAVDWGCGKLNSTVSLNVVLMFDGSWLETSLALSMPPWIRLPFSSQYLIFVVAQQPLTHRLVSIVGRSLYNYIYINHTTGPQSVLRCVVTQTKIECLENSPGLCAGLRFGG